MTEGERIARGERAKVEIGLTQESFDAVRENLIERMEESSDPAFVLQCHQGLQVLAKVRHALQLVVDDGLMAKAAVAQAGLARN